MNISIEEQEKQLYLSDVLFEWGFTGSEGGKFGAILRWIRGLKPNGTKTYAKLLTPLNAHLPTWGVAPISAKSPMLAFSPLFIGLKANIKFVMGPQIAKPLMVSETIMIAKTRNIIPVTLIINPVLIFIIFATLAHKTEYTVWIVAVINTSETVRLIKLTLNVDVELR